MNQTKVSTDLKLKGRDFITLGIFSVIFIILYMACVMLMSMTAYTHLLSCALGSLVAAPVYMLLRVKTPKTGAIIIFGIVFGVVLFAMGSGWPIFVCSVVGAAIAELIARTSSYKSYTKETIGYRIMMLLIAVGSFAPLIAMRDQYLQLASSNGVDADYYQQIAEATTGPFLVIALVVTIVTALIGAFIARGMFKKHFVKAGLIKEVK